METLALAFSGVVSDVAWGTAEMSEYLRHISDVWLTRESVMFGQQIMKQLIVNLSSD